MTREEAKAVINALVTLRNSATDEQALQAQAVYPKWRVGVNYTVGARVLYDSVLYKVLQEHTSQESWTPDISPSLFTKVLIPDDVQIYDWEQPDSTNGYMTGDKARHNDKVWISDCDNNVWEPGVYGWSEATA